MKKVILSLFILPAAIFVNAQMIHVPTRISTPRGNVTVNTPMPGATPAYHYGNKNFEPKAPTYFTVYLKDGQKFTGTGAFSNRLKDPFVRVDYYGKKRVVRPQETTKIIARIDSTSIEMPSYKNSNWLMPVDDSLKNIYRNAISDDGVFRKDDNNFKELTREEVLEIVKGNGESEILAEKGKLWQALKEFVRPAAISRAYFTPLPTKYTVTYRDNSTLTGHGIIENKQGKFQLTIMDQDKKKHTITPAETKSLTKIGKYTNMEAITHNDIWLFKTFDGKITGYSVDIESPTLFAVEYEDEIKRPTKDLILKMVSGNKNAEKEAQKGDFTKAVKLFNYVHPADARKAVNDEKN